MSAKDSIACFISEYYRMQSQGKPITLLTYSPGWCWAVLFYSFTGGVSRLLFKCGRRERLPKLSVVGKRIHCSKELDRNSVSGRGSNPLSSPPQTKRYRHLNSPQHMGSCGTVVCRTRKQTVLARGIKGLGVSPSSVEPVQMVNHREKGIVLVFRNGPTGHSTLHGTSSLEGDCYEWRGSDERLVREERRSWIVLVRDLQAQEYKTQSRI